MHLYVAQHCKALTRHPTATAYYRHTQCMLSLSSPAHAVGSVHTLAGQLHPLCSSTAHHGLRTVRNTVAHTTHQQYVSCVCSLTGCRAGAVRASRA